MITNEEEARAYLSQLAGNTGLERLERFARLLRAENQKQNLVAARSLDSLWQRHLADSAQLLEHVPRETNVAATAPWMDLGSGPGLPGLVLAILRPEIEIKLIESRKRRAEFLAFCRRELGLANCEVLGCRLERVERFRASVITARAFAPLPKLLHLSAPFSTDRTLYLLPKGRSAAQELDQANGDVRAMFHVEQSLTDREAGIIVGRLGNKAGAKAC